MTGWLIDTLLYTGLLIGLVLVLRRPAGRFFGPQLAYGLWALPFIRLLLPPIVLPASLAPEPASMPVSPLTEWTPVAMEAPVEPTAVPIEFDATPPVISAPVSAPAWEWSDFIVPAISLWAGVALAFLAWRVVTYRQMRRELLMGARPVGEIGKVRLIESPALSSPVAFGVLDKVIALPPLFMAQPDIAARDLAIAHELAHHRGHDLLANFAAQALLALHWFNPLAWMGWRAMRRDQEAACDARVLAGRGREERIRYAALIAGVATGPRLIAFRGALAAPMACQVLGERSIVHRLRSLSMSETSRRRRWLGRTLIASSALALPLSASISYAAAQESAPEAPITAIDPDAPDGARVPDAPDAEIGREFRTVIIRRGDDGEPVEQRIILRHPQAPQGLENLPQFHFQGEWDSEEFQQQMEQFQQQMEEFADHHGQNLEQWAEQYAAQWEQWGAQFGQAEARRAQQQAEGQQRGAEAQGRRAATIALGQQQRAQAIAMAAAAPQVITNCDDESRPTRITRGDDGRQVIVICNRAINVMARSSLRNARESIASNREISEDVRREVLQDLDEEIQRIEREED